MSPTLLAAFFELGEGAEGQVFDTLWGSSRPLAPANPDAAPVGVLYINAVLEALPRTIFQFAFTDRRLGVAYMSHNAAKN